MNLNYTLILGSRSARRQEIMRNAGFEFKVVSIDCEETFPPELDLHNIPKFLAEKKSRAYKTPLEENEMLITADTIVLLNNNVLGKPATINEAKATLTLLSGKSHEVITGVCLRTNGKTVLFQEKTTVSFVELSGDEIDYYIEKQNPIDKAGAYGIQEWIGLIGVESIIGSYYNVVGLPIHKLYSEMKQF